jgi:tRNA A37 methylthiotransferase MiaB
MADLRTRVPTLNLSADLICGFPGETEADFAETLRLAADLALSHVHAFTWSPRPGTPAAVMAGRIPERIRRERSTALRTAVAGQGKKFRDGMLGRTVRVLIERPGSGGLACGYSENYLPVAVRFPSPREAAAGRNTFVTLRVAGCGADGRLTGSLPSAVPDDPASAKNG